MYALGDCNSHVAYQGPKAEIFFLKIINKGPEIYFCHFWHTFYELLSNQFYVTLQAFIDFHTGRV